MLDQPSVTTDIISPKGKIWDNADELEVTFTMKTKTKTRAFKGIIYKKVGVNIIE